MNDIDDFITEEEHAVYSIIYKLPRKIGEPEQISNENLFRSVLECCSVVAVTNALVDIIEPENAAKLIKSLIQKGMIKEYTIDGYPSFVPIGYQSIKKIRVEEIQMPGDRNY